MILHKQNLMIDFVTTFFMNNIAGVDLTKYFNINISTNITTDYFLYDENYKLKVDDSISGLTMLPDRTDKKIQILISENACTPAIILHELTHMYDFILFAKEFCNGEILEIKNNKYYQTVIFWSEFHVKQIDIPYLQLFLDEINNIPKEQYLCDFKKQIKIFFYPEYTKKFLNKSNPRMRDIMWYLGEMVVCNLYDDENTYNIPEDIITIYGEKILELYQTLSNCLTFPQFAENIEVVHNLFFQ